MRIGIRDSQATPRRWAVGLSATLSVLVLAGLCSPAWSYSSVYQGKQRVYRGGTVYVQEVRAADQSMQTGRYEDAEARFTKILKASPSNLRARAGLAHAQAELFKLDPAEKNANLVLAKQPNNPDALTALGIVQRNRTASLDLTYRQQRDPMLAESARLLERAVAADPKSPEAHTQLGVTYRFQGDLDRAEAEFEKAASLDRRYAEAILNQGIVRMMRGDLAGAKSFYQQAIQLNSKNPMAHYRLGEAQLAADDPHTAIKTLNNALALHRANAAIQCKLAEAYDKQGNSAAAVAMYRRAMSANPSFMPAYTGLANLLDSRGDAEMAMAELKSALNVNPSYSPGRNQLGRLALVADKPEQAAMYFKESLQRNPQDSVAIQGLSQALTQLAVRSASTGQALGQDGDIVDAEKTIQEALRLNPDDLRLHLAALRVSQLAGKPYASDAELQTIVSSPAQTESEQMIQGEAFLALGRYEEADQVFRGMMQKANRDADRLLIIGDTLKACGDLDRAREAYQATLSVEPSNLKAQRGIQRIEQAQAESQKTLRLAKALNNFWQKTSSIDFYEDTLSQNPRQPDARLSLAKLYEKSRQYSRAANSYQHYLGLMPAMPEKDRQYYERKISRLQELAQKAANDNRTPMLQPFAQRPVSQNAGNPAQ